MNDIINIYFDSNVLQLELNENANDNSELIIETLKNFETNTFQKAKVYVNDFEDSLNKIQKKYPKIIACGGVVENEKQEVLFIFRRKKWDLPKGKLDKGETTEDCAIREVMEETGIKHLVLKDFLCSCFHIYNDKHQKRLVLKETLWYNMTSTSTENLIPQLEEDIEEIIWFAKKDLNTVFQNTFDSIKEVIGKKYL